MSQDRPVRASIEVVPKQVLGASDLKTWFPPGTRVYLPDVGNSPFEELASSAVQLRASGYEPVPHFPARRIKDKAELALRLNRLSSEAGVNDMLIIGGGLDREVGEFSSTMDLLDTGLIDNYGIKRISIAGHPEGSPDFSHEAAMKALRYKQAFHDRTDAELTIVTQFGFDADSFINWSEGLAEQGIDLSVHLGVVGPAKLTTLIKYAVMCGVGPSLQFLKKRASALTSLVSGFDPEIVVSPIEKHVQKNPDSAIKQIHVFPFGGARKAAGWLTDRGSWPQI
ncbi:MAG: methylenetetrahydrofolate reductase [Gammaproteobacteria bacterium]